MNERIQELMDQCEEEYSTQNYPCWDMEKFAELIVQECMGIISDESEKVSDEWRCKDGKHIWWKIKEHFGGQS